MVGSLPRRFNFEFSGSGLRPNLSVPARWKQHELPNVCPKDYYQLSEAARRTLRRMRRRPRLITAFWQQASLWP